MRMRRVWLLITMLAMLVTVATSTNQDLVCEPDVVPLATADYKQHIKSKCPFADKFLKTASWLSLLNNFLQQPPSQKETTPVETLVQPGTPEYGLFLNNRARASSRKRWFDSLSDVHRSKTVAKGIFQIVNDDTIPEQFIGNVLSSLNLPASQQSCPKPPVCLPVGKYRTIDGSCNNLKFTAWGQTNTQLGRLLSPTYKDGVDEPRESVVGGPLPNARVLSTTYLPDNDVPDEVNELMVMQIGQAVAHDTSLTPDQQSLKENISVNCCGADGNTVQGPNDKCLSIEIPNNDSFYSQFGRECMSMVRSMTTVSKKCQLGPAQQFCAVTHFVDASHIYGSDKDVADSLRLKIGGKLKTQKASSGGDFPPNSANPTEDCDIRPGDEPICYVGGDVRINQHPEMSVVQTLFLREHNRVADNLGKLNPHWNDERLYQESRRIVIGEWQNTVYQEYIAIVLGEEFVKKRKLTVLDGYSTGYDINLDPSTLNSFTTGCFRTFHSMAQGNILFTDENRSSTLGFPLREWFLRPSILQDDDNYDRMLRGLATQSAQTMDPFMTEDLNNFLFKLKEEFGNDLGAIDVQRSRDHGLPCYNDFRALCGLPRARNFSDFSDTIDIKYVEMLSESYADVDDVDFTLAIKLENILEGTLVGKTCQCIIGEQFYRWKFGDYWFYDFKNNRAPFTPDQLKEIKKSRLSKVICDNGDNIKEMQPDCFRHISDTNSLTDCDKLPTVNLRLWKESY